MHKHLYRIIAAASVLVLAGGGWVLATLNSLVVCVIGLRTEQLGFIPANVFCIGLYAVNVRNWRPQDTPQN